MVREEIIASGLQAARRRKAKGEWRKNIGKLQAIQHGKHGCVHADAECKSENSDAGEAGGAGKGTDGVSEGEEHGWRKGK